MIFFGATRICHASHFRWREHCLAPHENLNITFMLHIYNLFGSNSIIIATIPDTGTCCVASQSHHDDDDSGGPA